MEQPHLPARAIKIPRLEGGSIGPRTESLGKLGRTYGHGTVFAPRKYLHQKEATGMERPEMYPLVGATNPLTCAGHQNTASRGRQYRAQIGKLGKLGRTYGHDTVFAPRKYLCQKEATGKERPEMYSASRWNNPNYLRGPLKYPVSREAV